MFSVVELSAVEKNVVCLDELRRDGKVQSCWFNVNTVLSGRWAPHLVQRCSVSELYVVCHQLNEGEVKDTALEVEPRSVL